MVQDSCYAGSQTTCAWDWDFARSNCCSRDLARAPEAGEKTRVMVTTADDSLLSFVVVDLWTLMENSISLLIY